MAGVAEACRRCLCPVWLIAPMCSTWRLATRCCAGWRRRACARCCSTGAGRTEVERRFTMTDYVAGRLERAIAGSRRNRRQRRRWSVTAWAAPSPSRRPSAGRTCSAASGCWRHRGTSMPPTGSRPDAGRARCRCSSRRWRSTRPLPIDLLQVLFALLDPWGVADKYRAFARLAQTARAAELFVALEDWLNDGVPLAAPVARECLGAVRREHSGARRWRIAGMPVDPAAVRLPTFVAVPARDRIVPPEAPVRSPADPRGGAASAGGRAYRHGGRRRAERVLWRPLRDWLHGLG